MIPTWNKHCRICPGEWDDTQEHRFGLTHTQCEQASQLHQLLRNAITESTNRCWIPDQAVSIPRMEHESALATGLQTQEISQPTSNNSPKDKWKPMVNIGTIWVNALHLGRTYDFPAQLPGIKIQLAWEQSNRRGWPHHGQMLPRRIHQAALCCHPQLTSLDIRIAQWDGLGKASFERPGPHPSHVPPGNTDDRYLWLDDIYQLRTPQW